jgi:hypothetical protein
MQRRWFSVAVVGLMIAVSAPARAADNVDAREREARKACFTGDVARGVELLVDLYGETGHPNYIFNQARCFERNGKYDQALLSYEDYLRKATNLPEADRAQVEKSIAELRAKLASTAPPSDTGGTTAPGLLTPSLDGPEPGPGKPNDLITPTAPDVRPADRRLPWQTTAGVISLIAAGGGLALGVAGTVLRQSRSSDFNDQCTIDMGVPTALSQFPGTDCRGRYDSVQAASRMMWIGYVSGGALAAAGVTLLLIAPHADKAAPMAGARRCGPLFAASGETAGVTCGGSF